MTPRHSPGPADSVEPVADDLGDEAEQPLYCLLLQQWKNLELLIEFIQNRNDLL